MNSPTLDSALVVDVDRESAETVAPATQPWPIDRPTAGGAATVERVPRKKSAASRAFMHWTRRIHLYGGLLMLPWVFLYGVTGFLFNHHGIISGNETVTYGKAEVAGSQLEGLPLPADLAEQVVAIVNERSAAGIVDSAGPGGFEGERGFGGERRGGPGGRRGAGRGPRDERPREAAAAASEVAAAVVPTEGTAAATPGMRYKLIRPDQARFDRGGLRVSVRGADEKMYSLTVQPDGAGGTYGPEMFRGRGPGMERAPFAVREGVTLSDSPLPRLEQGAAEILPKLGVEGATVVGAQVAPLSFMMEGEDGSQWRVTYDTERGSVTGQKIDPDATNPMTFETFLLRLHTAHHYPDEFNIRWIWAVIVDVMSGIMVFWGLSGVLMWWQIKRTRLLGASLLVTAVLIAAVVGPLMYEVFVTTLGR